MRYIEINGKANEHGKRRVTYSYPERYFDGDAQYRQKRYETWWENGQKVGQWDWVPVMSWNGNWMDG